MVEEVAQPRVALRLRAGEIDGPLFQDVMVYDLSSNLREFLEAALKDLEVSPQRERPGGLMHGVY